MFAHFCRCFFSEAAWYWHGDEAKSAGDLVEQQEEANLEGQTGPSHRKKSKNVDAMCGQIPRRFLWYESCEDEYGPGARSWRGMMRLWYILAYIYIMILYDHIFIWHMPLPLKTPMSQEIWWTWCITASLCHSPCHTLLLSATTGMCPERLGHPPWIVKGQWQLGTCQAYVQPTFVMFYMILYDFISLYLYIYIYIYMFHWLLHDEETIFEIHLGTRPFADHLGRCDNLNQIKEIN